ncbi:Exonuclease 1 [Paramuricea clavata]|uniref:Exonuclease 1 n=1 Tax=Paramuricea clavata TaxID=317549 RepID=A0A6S7K6N2_PARCT|nr:Exonuclease 1 [Paramuricea clavata]
MGIKTLLPFLREVTRKANLEEFKGQTAAVDASCLLHRALSISMSRNGDESRLLDLLNSYVDLLERNEIKPYVVFDGLRLPAKELERVKRTRRREEIRAKANELRKEGEVVAANKLLAGETRITYAITTEFIRLCRDRNIDYTVAPYEADAKIAYLMKHGQVLFKMETSGMCDCIELSDALENLGMTQTKFLKMCIVAGCDYLPNIRGIGINQARKLVVEEADLMKALLNLKNVPEGDDISTVSKREHNNEDDTTEIKVTITSIEYASFPWRIPSLPVITLNFKKVKFTLSNGQQCNGVVNKDIDIDIEPGRFCCSSHCTIRVDNEDLVVLWTLSPLKNTIQSVARVQVRNVGEETDDYSGEHTLPFKVMGTCYWTSRQDALEEAYTYLAS